LNNDSQTVAYYQTKVEVTDGDTTEVVAGTYKSGSPGEAEQLSESGLDSFGPNGEALLTATFAADTDFEPEVTVDLELISGEGLAQEEGSAQALNRSVGESGRQCGTCFIAPEDVEQANSVRAQSVRYQVSQVGPGENLDFFVITTFQTVTAQRILTDAQTEHCLIFAELDNGTPVISEQTALAIAEGFDSDNPFQEGDNGIYEDTRARYGSEWVLNGGRDGDERVVLLFLSSDSIGGTGLFGFFNPADERSKESNESSNEAEMLYVNADRAESDLYDVLGTIAHEFSHLIIFNQKIARNGEFPDGAVSENAVLDEGLAVLNEELSGFSYTGTDGGNFFLLSAVSKLLEDGLNRTYFQFGGQLSDYGAGYLFWRYIHDQAGIEAIHSMTTSTSVGRANVEAVLGVPFAETFRNYTQAVALNGRDGLEPELEFTNLDLFGDCISTNGTEFNLQGLQGIRSVSLPGTLTTSLPIQPWGTEFYDATGGDGSALTWRAQGSSIVTGVVPLSNAE
ncbi:MAG: hypothetical protein KC800_33280, partial [Candidatus Eremiobacteraeota bacterium]|nr:hypothetical protein [Candidatus Eremiobacteraeota bacterium]